MKRVKWEKGKRENVKEEWEMRGKGGRVKWVMECYDVLSFIIFQRIWLKPFQAIFLIFGRIKHSHVYIYHSHSHLPKK